MEKFVCKRVPKSAVLAVSHVDDIRWEQLRLVRVRGNPIGSRFFKLRELRFGMCSADVLEYYGLPICVADYLNTICFGIRTIDSYRVRHSQTLRRKP